jgi:hypothetical protein
VSVTQKKLFRENPSFLSNKAAILFWHQASGWLCRFVRMRSAMTGTVFAGIGAATKHI